jgi:hypothetical protein
MDSPAPRRTRFDHRTKTEHGATILVPNSVAAHDTERGVVDGLSKILKENKIVLNQQGSSQPSSAEIVAKSLVFGIEGASLITSSRGITQRRLTPRTGTAPSSTW